MPEGEVKAQADKGCSC